MSENKKWIDDFLSGLLGGFISVTNSEYSVKKYDGFMDALKTIKREEGLRGFYKGYNVTVISIPLFHSLFFSIYNQAKPFINKTCPSLPSSLQYLISSTFTGVICDTLTNPLWVVRTRLQVQYMHKDAHHYTEGLYQTMQKICKEEGFSALYKGLGASFLGLSHVAVYFPIYEKIKEAQQTHREALGQQLKSQDIFVASIISKLIASCVTYPHVVIRTRLQDCRGAKTSAQIRSVAKEIIHKEGYKGLYRGLRVDLVRVLPANTITFIAYEYFTSLLQGGRHRLSKEH